MYTHITYIHMYIYTYTRIHTCIHVYTYTHTHIYTYTHTHIHIYIMYMYTHIHIYTYMLIQKHIQINCYHLNKHLVFHIILSHHQNALDTHKLSTHKTKPPKRTKTFVTMTADPERFIHGQTKILLVQSNKRNCLATVGCPGVMLSCIFLRVAIT